MAALERGEDIDYDGASSSLDMNETGDLISPMISVTHNADGLWFHREIIQLDPYLSATAPAEDQPAGSPVTARWPDFVPTDPGWEPATILTFEGLADEIVEIIAREAPVGTIVGIVD